jgi:hypothetical protein
MNFVSMGVLSFWAVTVTGCRSEIDDSLVMRAVESGDVPVAEVSLRTVGGSCLRRHLVMTPQRRAVRKFSSHLTWITQHHE